MLARCYPMSLRRKKIIIGISLPPANVVCEGYVFTPVCQSFCSQGEGCLLPGGVASSRGVPGGDPPGTATAAGGTHPTGMHSCYHDVTPSHCHKNRIYPLQRNTSSHQWLLTSNYLWSHNTTSRQQNRWISWFCDPAINHGFKVEFPQLKTHLQNISTPTFLDIFISSLTSASKTIRHEVVTASSLFLSLSWVWVIV